MKVGSLYFNDPWVAKLLGGESYLVESYEDIFDLDLLVFWGGSDVNPALYKEKNVKAYAIDPQRDKFEQFIYNKAVGTVPMLGICRGAQFLCVQGGGRLWQHVDGHQKDHRVKLPNGEVFLTTSTHHQMMRPTPEMEVLGVSEYIMSRKKWSGAGEEEPDEPEAEIVFDPNASALMIQGHPEYAYAHDGFKEVTRKLIKKYLGL